jgi:hypothetical protein
VRLTLALLALAVGGFAFWLALRSNGGDWYASQIHGDIFFSGIWSFRQIAFFSFAFNGGTYLLQDPQGHLLSPTLLFIVLLGPTFGLRLAVALWTALGFLAFTAWMRRRVSLPAALLGALASVTSLSVLWRIAVGNDMFIWQLALPALLWLIERVMRARTWRSALVLGLALGVLLLGPTFQSFTFLFAPALLLFVPIELAFLRPSKGELARIAGLFVAACALAVLIASPKFVCWLTMPMSRTIADSGVMTFGDALRCLFDYSISASGQMWMTSWKGAIPVRDFWDIPECSVALSPLGSGLALLGLVAAVLSKPKRPSALFAVALCVLGLSMACSWFVWNTLREFTHSSFRVAPRYLVLPTFGLSVLAAVGADALFARLPRAKSFLMPLAACIMFVSAIGWVHAASQSLGNTRDDDVHPEAINPFAALHTERELAAGLKTFSRIKPIDLLERDVLLGVGAIDGFPVMGNADANMKRWKTRGSLPILIDGIAPSDVTIDNLSVELRHLEPRARVRLRLVVPREGYTLTTEPSNAPVQISEVASGMLIQSESEQPIERVRLTTKLPLSPLWFLLSGVAMLGTLVFLFWKPSTKGSPRVHQEAPAPSAAL